MGCEYVHIPLHDIDGLFFGDGGCRQIQGKQMGRFVINGGAHGIKIFGLLIPYGPASESYHCSSVVPDREDQPAVEFIKATAVPGAAADQPGFDKQVFAVALGGEMLGKGLPISLRRETKAKAFHHSLVYTPLAQIG